MTRSDNTVTQESLDGSPESIRPEQLTEALRLMTLSRRFDERAFSLQRQGKLGTFSQALGQEASIAGSALALDPARDWIVPQYREVAALVRHGYPLSQFFLYFRGHPAGASIPPDVKALPIQISLAAQLPHAVGLAWGLQLQSIDSVVLAYFGDGASSEGDFHESCNLAGVTSAPVVFFLQNNGWAISTPRSKQSAATSLAARAAGYGIRGVMVDGDDVVAVYQATREAVDQARRGNGPTLIESMTHRMGAHNTADDPTKYIAAVEEGSQVVLDPIDRLKDRMTADGLWDAERDAVLLAEVEVEIEQALATADAVPPPDSSVLFDHVFTVPPDRFTRQRTEFAEPGSTRRDR